MELSLERLTVEIVRRFVRAQPKQGYCERKETESNGDHGLAGRTEQAGRFYVLPSIIGTNGADSRVDFILFW